METFAIKSLTYYYPEQKKPALDSLSIDIKQGEFVTLVGPSGCGKSTFLRQLKTALSPCGIRSGEIFFEGKPLEAVEQRQQAARIGFVQQNPETQIVTDKVWHELAFGLESLGFDTQTIRRRVAEMASYFGIQGWFYKKVFELSGGQKQLLNLAAVMTLQPSVLILDEPTSQLDPIAASDFLATVGKINRELGTTIIITEHRLEEVFTMSNRVIVMDDGKVIAEGSPKEVGLKLKDRDHSMFLAMPTAMRAWAAVSNDFECPLTVREGREWLEKFTSVNEVKELEPERIWKFQNIKNKDKTEAVSSAAKKTVNLGEALASEEKEKCFSKKESVISLKDVWFKYEKDGPDIIKGLSLEVEKGQFMSLLGGNGTGKTTALSIIGKINKHYRGEVKTKGSIGILPQNPQTLLVKKTVREDISEILKGKNLSKEEKNQKLTKIINLCRLEELLDRHPYDLSGGEMQRAALAKVLLLEPEILILDEATKGLDANFKQIFAEIMKRLQRKGVTILMVSHDVEFCAEYTDRCALFFDGNIVTEGTPRTFFSGNNFYTTSGNRMARQFIPQAVTAADIVWCLGGKVLPAISLSEEEDIPDTPKEKQQNEEKLPLWRKLLAVASGIVVIWAFISAIGITDLSLIISAKGLSDLTGDYIKTYGLFMAALLVLAVSITKKRRISEEILQVKPENRKLPKRTLVATVVILILIPITMYVGIYYLGGRKYYFITLLMLLEIMTPFAIIFEKRKPQPRELVVISVLCAIGVAGRAAFFMLPNFTPVMALVIISAVAFGGESGFLIGAMTMVASNVMFGQGPWTPWQMFAMGLVGYLAGVFYHKGLLRRSRGSLCCFGAICAIIVYGGIMNPAAALMWAHEINRKMLITYYISGFPMDLIHAFSTVIFLWFGAEPMLEKLDRIKVKYGLVSVND